MPVKFRYNNIETQRYRIMQIKKKKLRDREMGVTDRE